MAWTKLSVGDQAEWPNGTVGTVCGLDESDHTIMDDCGGWHNAREVEPA